LIEAVVEIGARARGVAAILTGILGQVVEGAIGITRGWSWEW
jgi:hypothetical protein